MIKIFFISCLAATLVLGIENLSGIDWKYHPDAITYTTQSTEQVYNILNGNLLQIFNNFYYFIATLVNNSVFILIGINILLFSLSNVIIYGVVKQRRTEQGLSDVKGWDVIVLLLVLFMPYRLHLSVHVLKDTIIIFALTGSVFYGGSLKLFNIFLMLLMRVYSILYLSVLLKMTYVKMLIILSILFFASYPDLIFEFVDERNSIDMTFRDYDTIPNFTQYGTTGGFVRLVIWPILAITGAYIFFSMSPAFLPIGIVSLVIFIICLIKKRWGIFDLRILASMGLISITTTGYTTYIRYCFPLIVIASIYSLIPKRSD